MCETIEKADVHSQVQDWARRYAGRRLAILGAGQVGIELLLAMRGTAVQVVGLMDDFALPDSQVDGQPVLPSKILSSLQVDAVILGTTKARARMQDRLKHLCFTGDILSLPGQDDDIFAPQTFERVCAIEKFHNLHAGQRAFVIGNGPSLKRTDPRRIRDAVTFGCNSIFLLNEFEPTYYCVEDHICAEDRCQQINALPWSKFLAGDLRRWLTNGHFFNGHRAAEIDTFNTDFAAGIQVGASVAFTMMQLAFYMGCDPVYLIGLDHSYDVSSFRKEAGTTVLTATGHDVNHFDARCIANGLRSNYPNMARMEKAYGLSRETFTRYGRQIYNATAGGRLETFDRLDFETIVNGPLPE